MRLGAGKLFQFQRFVVGQDAVGDEPLNSKRFPGKVLNASDPLVETRALNTHQAWGDSPISFWKLAT